jgi:hypothetical protein
MCADGAGANSLLFPAPENGRKGIESDGKGKARVPAPVRSALPRDPHHYVTIPYTVTAVYRKVFGTIRSIERRPERWVSFIITKRPSSHLLGPLYAFRVDLWLICDDRRL